MIYFLVFISMKHVDLSMNNVFGSSCTEGNKAVSYLRSTVYPLIEEGNFITFDFDNVRAVNSSFGNALFFNLIIRHGPSILLKIKIVNARGNVKKEIASNIDFAIKRTQEDCSV